MNQAKKSFRQFLIIWTGQLLSRIGSGISAFTLGVHLYQKSGSTSAYSFLLLAAFLPSVMLAPIGGVIADRRNRKLMMALGDIGSSFGILFIIAMLYVYPDKYWPSYLGVAVSSLFVALHAPAFKSSVTDFLDEKEYARASGMIQFAEASRYLLAPVIAAYLLTRLRLQFVLAIDMATFVLAAVTVLLVSSVSWQRVSTLPRGRFREELADGIRYIASNNDISRLLILTMAVTFFTGILQALFVPIILSFTDATALGIIQSTAASGMILGSILIGLFSKTSQQNRTLLLSLFAAGFFYLLIGTTTKPVLLTVTAFGFFFTLPFVNTSLEVLFRRNIANDLQGRVWSLISLLSQTGMLVAFGVAGILADHFFNPLLDGHGPVSDILGKILGTGPARGSGLMIIISGCMLMACALFYKRKKRVHEMIQTA
ncbi:MFS transporter [bacterium]|nr:MFS transporter [bacterium]